MRLALLLSLVLPALAGCSWIGELDPMPVGYTYQNDVYKGQPGLAPPSVGYPFSPERNDVIMEKWQAAAAVLVTELESQQGLEPRPVYLEMLPNDNAFNYSLDQVLRTELRKRGYWLENAPNRSLHIRPEAYLPEDDNVFFEVGNFNGEPDVMTEPFRPERAKKFLISLTLVRDDEALGKIQDSFLLPAYGYVRGEGRQRWQERVKEISKHQAMSNDRPADSASAPTQLVPEAVETEVIGEPR